MSQPTGAHESLDDVFVGRLLAMTARAMRANADRNLAPHDADLTTWVVLSAATHAPPGALSQSRLADGMGIGAPALIRHIDRLEKAGLVRRERDETDRRVTRITITPTGKRLHRRLEKVMVARDDELRGHLDEGERDTLVRLLRKVYEFAVTDGSVAEGNAP